MLATLTRAKEPGRNREENQAGKAQTCHLIEAHVAPEDRLRASLGAGPEASVDPCAATLPQRAAQREASSVQELARAQMANCAQRACGVFEKQRESPMGGDPK